MRQVSAALPEDCHLSQFLSMEEPSDFQMAIVGEERSGALAGILGELFENQPVSVIESDLPDEPEDTVVLLEDGEVAATSPLEALSRTILTVNSDLYITGTVDLEEIDLPDVIEALSETTFHVRGYPESHYEKLPLILISRYIERLSFTHGGTHRASFQRLSRIVDERGTQNVYRKLSAAGVNTHVYRIPDWSPPRELNVVAHGGYGGDFDSTWFVLHRSEAASAALVAIEVGPNEWLGEWTFEDDRVDEIESTITTYL